MASERDKGEAEGGEGAEACSGNGVEREAGFELRFRVARKDESRGRKEKEKVVWQTVETSSSTVSSLGTNDGGGGGRGGWWVVQTS